MFRLFKRTSDGDPTHPPAPSDDASDYRATCRAIHSAYLEAEEGTLDREVFLQRKVVLLRAAVRDAEARDEGASLVHILETLRLTCAINDVELESVRRHFGD